MSRCAILAPTLDHGDALSHFVLLVAEALRGLGWEAEVRAPHVHPKLRSHVRAGTSPPGGLSSDDLLILVHSSTSPWLAAFDATPARRMLLYTGITPPALCEPHAPHLAARLRQAIAELQGLTGKAEHALCTSETAAAELTEHTDGQVETRIVPLVIDESLYPSADRSDERPVGEPPRLLVVGRVVPHKRIETAIAVHACLQATFNLETRLDIVGDHTLCPDYTAHLERLQRDRPGMRPPVFHGKVSFDQLMGFYREADALLMTSAHEGFGVPLLEAMLMGIPIVASHCAGTAETLGDAGLVCSEPHPAVMAEVVEMVWRNEGLRNTLIERGRERATVFGKRTLPNRLGEALV